VRQTYSYRLDVCPSVRPSVCPSHAGIVSKRLNLSSNCLHCLLIFALLFTVLSFYRLTMTAFLM